jgi:hypothetical protein
VKNKKSNAALAVLLIAAPLLAFAEPDEDIARSLSVQCDYADYKTLQVEAVSIERTVTQAGEAAAIRTFERGEKSQSATFTVRAGEFAECVFPSGKRVRAKVGEGRARPYGACGGDPDVFGSIWVNERKVASRFWFAGRCREFKEDAPDVSFKVSGRVA